MAFITNDLITNSWSAGITLAANETWQCTDGIVEVTAEAAPGLYDGIRLEGGRGLPIAAGKTVRYRRVGTTPALIKREAF